MTVEVSILLPTFNSIRFLEERINSILSQTCTDWEVIVADSHSADGTWECLSELAERDQRFRLFQVPAEGVYPALNFLIREAKGRYLYFATSDDTMVPACLEHLRSALDAFPSCDLCHSGLKVIEASGAEIPGWWNQRPATKYFGEWESRQHVRMAPHDGILHVCMNNVYGSLTQIMVRRSLFDRVGPFPCEWGPRGDFAWGMKVGILCNVVHIPRTLATWRIHEDQLTQKPRGDLLLRMTESLLPLLESEHPKVYARLNIPGLISHYRSMMILQKIQAEVSVPHRLQVALRSLLRHPLLTSRVITMQLLGRSILQSNRRINYLRRHMQELQLDGLVRHAGNADE